MALTGGPAPGERYGAAPDEPSAHARLLAATSGTSSDGSFEPPPEPAGDGWRAEALTGLGCLAAVAVVGVPVGLLWRAIAPRAVAVVSDKSVDLVNSETKAFIAADGTLLLLGLAGGLLTALATWRFARRRGVGTLLGLLVGAGLAGFLAWRTGLLGQDRQTLLQAVRAGRLTGLIDLPLQLRARSVLLAWPAAAALTWLGLILWRSAPPRATAPAWLDPVAPGPDAFADGDRDFDSERPLP